MRKLRPRKFKWFAQGHTTIIGDPEIKARVSWFNSMLSTVDQTDGSPKSHQILKSKTICDRVHCTWRKFSNTVQRHCTLTGWEIHLIWIPLIGIYMSLLINIQVFWLTSKCLMNSCDTCGASLLEKLTKRSSWTSKAEDHSHPGFVYCFRTKGLLIQCLIIYDRLPPWSSNMGC